MGAGAEGGRFHSNLEVIYWLHLSRRDLVLAKPEEQQIDAWHIFAALAGAAEPDWHLNRQAGRDRGQYGSGARPRLPRRDAIAGLKPTAASSPAGAAAGRGFSRRGDGALD